jgi:hypothetical protein
LLPWNTIFYWSSIGASTCLGANFFWKLTPATMIGTGAWAFSPLRAPVKHNIVAGLMHHHVQPCRHTYIG